MLRSKTRTKKFQSQTNANERRKFYIFSFLRFDVCCTRAELRMTYPLLCDRLLYHVRGIHNSWETTAEYISHTSRPPVILPLQLPFYMCTLRIRETIRIFDGSMSMGSSARVLFYVLYGYRSVQLTHTRLHSLTDRETHTH